MQIVFMSGCISKRSLGVCHTYLQLRHWVKLVERSRVIGRDLAE